VGSPGSAVETPRREATGPGPIPGYLRLDGPVPLFHAPRLAEGAREVLGHLTRGSEALSGILMVEPPELSALLVAEEDWEGAPGENAHPYPPGLPYFTRSVAPPALVLPEGLSPVFRPRTAALLPLAVWHELAHAFLLGREVVRMPAWLGELVPQAASAAVARRVGERLGEHLALVGPDPGFTVRGFGGRVGAEDQMKYQNLLLGFGATMLERFGEGLLACLFRALWEEQDVVDEERALGLLAGSLGAGGAAWLLSRPEF
jgi:hypothetical protein